MARVDQAVLDELLEDYRNNSKDYVVSKWIIERIPMIFGEDRSRYLLVKNNLAHYLNVDSCSIIFVGSSCTGFSLSPFKDFKEFDEKSDIDIAIISHYYFNVAWRVLRYINLSSLTPNQRESVKDHQNKYVYYGIIATDKILSLLPFGEQWQSAIDDLQKDDLFKEREVHFRLYQDHESLRDYHVHGINTLENRILGVSAANTVTPEMISNIPNV